MIQTNLGRHRHLRTGAPPVLRVGLERRKLAPRGRYCVDRRCLFYDVSGSLALEPNLDFSSKMRGFQRPR